MVASSPFAALGPRAFRWLVVAVGLYSLFCLVSASRLVFIEHFGWGTFSATRMVIFVTAIIWIVTRFPEPALQVGRLCGHGHPTCGDPLLFVRVVACVFVLFQHGMGITFSPVGLRENLWSGLWLLIPSGWIGVWLFFFLSGYLMGKGFFAGRYRLDRRGVTGFYRNRLLKIVPAYILVFLLAAWLLEPTIFSRQHIWMVLSILLFDYDGKFPINPVGSLWSVATEMQFYAIAPVLAFGLESFLSGRRKRAFMLALVACLTYGLMYRQIGGGADGQYWQSAVFTSFLGNADLFIGGMLLALFIQQNQLPAPPVWMGVTILSVTYLIGAYVVSTIMSGANYLTQFENYGPTATELAAIAVVFCFETAVMVRRKVDRLSSALIARTQLLGILTYNIYLLHEPIQKLLAILFKDYPLTVAGSVGLLSSATILAVVIALFLHRTLDIYSSRMRYRGLRTS